jgi:hypothetical protein
MTFATFRIISDWQADGLTPAEIGDRFLETLRRLEPLDPAMNNWLLVDGPREECVTLSDAAPMMTSFVEQNVCLSDFEYGDPDPDQGYIVVAHGSRIPESSTPGSINVSAHTGGKWVNYASFEVGGTGISPPDISLVTYPIYKGALEVIASVWPCPWALAFSFTPGDDDVLEWDGVSPIEDLIARDTTEYRRPFGVAWIAYLSPPLAVDLNPPPPLVWERTPGGGMILSAVEERLDETNPEHVRRAALLEAIMNERVGVIPGKVPQAAELPARTAPY